MTTAMPNIQVEFYTPTYSLWTDVSSYLMTDQGVSIKRGRGTRFDTSGVGTCSFVLDNFTGNFTPANSSSAFAGYGDWAIKNQPVRVTIDSVQVFTGFVDSWSAAVSSSGECLTTVVASDAMKFLGTNPLAAYGVERCKQIVGTTGVVYPLAQSVGADTTAQFSAWRDSSAGALSVNGVGAAGQWEFATEAPPFGSGSFHGIADDTSSNGCGVNVPQTVDISTGGTIFGAFRTSDKTSHFSTLYYMDRSSALGQFVFLYINGANGKVYLSMQPASGTAYSITSTSSNFNDDGWHSFALIFSATGKSVTLYIDAANEGSTSSATTWTISSSGRRNTFGVTTLGGSGVIGYLSTIGVTSTALANGTMIHNAIIKGDNGDTITTRTQNLLKCLYPSGTPSIAIANTSAITLTGQSTGGANVLTALNEIADTERGVVYVDRLGGIKFRGSTARSAAYSLTFDALADLDGFSDCTLIADDSTFANRILASGPAGSYIAEDATSIATLGIISESWSCISTSLTGATDPPMNRLTARLGTEPRIGQVTVDLMTATSVSKSSAISLVPLDCIRLTNLPSQLGATTRDAIVEGYALNASVNNYTLTLDLSPTG